MREWEKLADNQLDKLFKEIRGCDDVKLSMYMGTLESWLKEAFQRGREYEANKLTARLDSKED